MILRQPPTITALMYPSVREISHPSTPFQLSRYSWVLSVIVTPTRAGNACWPKILDPRVERAGLVGADQRCSGPQAVE